MKTTLPGLLAVVVGLLVTGAHAHRKAQHAAEQQQAEDEAEDQHVADEIGPALGDTEAVLGANITTPAPGQQSQRAPALHRRS